jgi:hypothetical protein
MKWLRIVSLKKVALVAVLATLQMLPPTAYAKSPVKLQKWIGEIDLSDDDPVPFKLAGTASHLGKFKAHGEVEFIAGEEEGTLIGSGVVVFEAANGDLLVGVVTWDVDEEVDGFRDTAIHFSWRDSVEFSDGTVVSNTGRFVNDRPPGLVVIAIIAVILPLLLPAIQKVK